MMRRRATRNVSDPGSDLLRFEGFDCVGALKALGEDTRVRIMGLLLEAPLGVCEIARRLGTTHYNISKHLRILREAGLLDVERHGRERLYMVPERIRRGRRAHAKVLDLGCCSFQFDQRS
jgi:DNA-binding transcriptional ArsR family regulator